MKLEFENQTTIHGLLEDAMQSKESGENPFAYRYLKEDGTYIDYDFVKSADDKLHILFMENWMKSLRQAQELVISKEELEGKNIGRFLLDTTEKSRQKKQTERGER